MPPRKWSQRSRNWKFVAKSWGQLMNPPSLAVSFQRAEQGLGRHRLLEVLFGHDLFLQKHGADADAAGDSLLEDFGSLRVSDLGRQGRDHGRRLLEIVAALFRVRLAAVD